MVKPSVIALFILGISLAGNAQSVSGPKISFTQTIIDYGEVAYGSDGERPWTFKNEGTAPLLITDVKGSCGCTVAKYPRGPIQPGREGTVKIRYDTKRTGLFSKTATIITNEPEDRNFHVITIMGRVGAAPEGTPQPKRK